MLSRRVELAIGIFTIAFSAILLAVLIPYGIVTPRKVRLLVLSPLFWPSILGVLLLLCGIILTIQGWLSSDDASAEPGPEYPGRPGVLRLAALLALIIVYYLAIPLLGMVWASVLAFLALIAITGTKRWISACVVALVLPLALYSFFNHVAGVPIPQGQLVRLP